MSDLFNKLSEMRSLKIPCALQAAAEIPDPATGRLTLVRPPGSKPILFEIQQVSPDDMAAADATLNSAKPPRDFHEESRPGTMGVIKVYDGYNTEDPDYLAERQKLLLTRNAYVCLYGCPALMASTPGETMPDKARELNQKIGAIALAWLCDKIENQTIFAGAGEEEVAIFLAGKSGGASSSGNTSGKSRRPAKKKPSSAKTARRSTTKSAKRPASGA